MGYREADTFIPPVRHAARIDQSVNQDLSGGVFSVLTNGRQIEDTDTYFDPAADDRFTIPAGLGGLYLFVHSAAIDHVTPGMGADWVVNGADSNAGRSGSHVVQVAGASAATRLSCGALRSLVATDFLQPRSLATNGGIGAVNQSAFAGQALVKLDT